MKHLILILILGFIFGCQTRQNMETRHQEMIENYIQAYNAFDIEGMCRDMSGEVIFQNVANGEVNLETKGIAAFREQADKAKKFFSEREQKITDIEMGTGSASVLIDYTGVLATDLSENMKAGDTLRLKGKSIFHFQDDKIIRIIDES